MTMKRPLCCFQGCLKDLRRKRRSNLSIVAACPREARLTWKFLLEAPSRPRNPNPPRRPKKPRPTLPNPPPPFWRSTVGGHANRKIDDRGWINQSCYASSSVIEEKSIEPSQKSTG